MNMLCSLWTPTRLSRLVLVSVLAISPHLAVAEPLAERLARVVDEHPASKRAHVGVMVVDAATGETVFARNEDRLFTPASNTKLYTSAFALATWGKDKTFATTLSAQGTVEGTTLEGRMTLGNEGDPVLAANDFAAMSQELVAKSGMANFVGYVDANCTYPGGSAPLDERPWGPGWMWDDFPDAYSMEISRPMLDYNTFSVSVQGTPQDPALSIRPAVDGTLSPVQAMLRPQQSASWSASRMKLGGVVAVVRPENPGDAPLPGEFQFASWKSVHFVRSVLLKTLADAGIACEEELPTDDSQTQGMQEWSVVHNSPPLSVILARFLKPSENAIGEMLFLNLAEHLGGAWDWPDAEKAERAWLEQTVGLASDEFRLVDGSGLSRYNLITAAATVKLLRFMHGRPDFDVYEAALPIAGVDGTLSGRMKETPAAGRVHAKTGTMSGVSCLSGYAPAADGRTLAFSILVNGYVGSSAPARDIQDKLCVELVSPDEPSAPAQP